MSAITYTLGKGYNGRDAKGCRNCPHRVGSHRTFNLWNCVAPGRVCCPVLVPSGYCRISHPSDRRPVILASAHNGWCPPSARLKSGATQMSEIAGGFQGTPLAPELVRYAAWGSMGTSS